VNQELLHDWIAIIPFFFTLTIFFFVITTTLISLKVIPNQNIR